MPNRKNRIIKCTWGNDHSLMFVRRPKRLLASLKIVKKDMTQTIPISLPHDLTLQEILKAWCSQGKQWHELEVTVESPVSRRFTALGVIWLPRGRAIVWNVLHINNRPYDTCSVTMLTKEVWSQTF